MSFRCPVMFFPCSVCLYKEATDKKQETELLTEYPLDNFPRPPYSVGRKNVPAKSHFRSTRTDDQSSPQFLGTPLQTVGTVSRRLESNDISVGKIRHRLVFAGGRKNQAAWETVTVSCVSF